jgi:hypothetical protein
LVIPHHLPATNPIKLGFSIPHLLFFLFLKKGKGVKKRGHKLVVICLDPISNTAIIFYKWTEIFEEVIEGEGEDASGGCP